MVSLKQQELLRMKSGKRHLSTSSERGTSNSENRSTSSSSSPLKSPLNKSSSDSACSSSNGMEKKRNGSLNHSKSSKRRLSENNSDCNSPTTPNGHHSKSVTSKLQKPKVIHSPTHSNHDQEACSSSKSISYKITTDDPSVKPIREAKKRSLIYTGNTREFLATAIAAGIIDDNGEEEDDNEYVPPGGRVITRPQPSSSSSSDNEEEEEESERNTDDNEDASAKSSDDDAEEVSGKSSDDDDEKNSGDEMVINEEVNENEINWNVKNRPQRQAHLVRFNTMSKQDEEKFFEQLQEQVPGLAALLDDNSDDEYQINSKEVDETETKSARKSSSKKARRTQHQDSSEQDEETVEMIKKFRHINVPSEKSTKKRKSHSNETTTISAKNRSDELYILLNGNAPRNVISGLHFQSSGSTKKNSIVQSFHFDRRQAKLPTVEDFKAPWRCIFCWKEPYEEYLGPLFGPFQLNEQCRGYLHQNKQLAKHYRKLKEIWLHRDCALWNNHIQMNPTNGELMHVSDACSTYLDITCSVCQIPGAALACRYRNCKIRYHYPCVKSIVDCRLSEENYSVYCPKHNQINNKKSKSNRRKTTTSVNDSQDSTMN